MPEHDSIHAVAHPPQELSGPSAPPFLLTAFRILYAGLMVAAASIPIINSPAGGDPLIHYIMPIAATLAVAAIVVLLDIRTPFKRISNVVGVYVAVVAGLFASLAVGVLIDLIAEAWDMSGDEEALKYLTLLKLTVGLTLCYIAISVVLSTRDSIRLVIPYVEFSKQVRGLRPMLLDTSALIDGRMNSFAQTGFMDAPLIVPQFVINELHTLADSADRMKRDRGRRGLDNLRLMQDDPGINIDIEQAESHSTLGVDAMLVDMAVEKNLRIVTTDANLARVADISDASTLNLNDLGGLLREAAVPGESMQLAIVRIGESEGQGVGYLPDGTMVVVEHAATKVGQDVNVTITNAVQTSAGRLIFATADAPPPSLRDSATRQDRHTGPGPTKG
ncbi:MAG: TRAM domain-containing protein [Phycisphaerales bacterium]|nr:TRAM domain-containing protein [Phycisphaerales bacterium]